MTFIAARDGTRLHIARHLPPPDAPARPDVLCLTGLTRNTKDFDRLGRDLAARGHRVFALDYRGRGRSERAADPMSYAAPVYIDDITAVLAALNLHRVVVIGTSLGGFLAMGMAVAMPSAIVGAVLNDAGPDVPEGGLARILAYVRAAPTYPDWNGAIDAVKKMLPDLNLDADGWRAAAEGCFAEQADGRIQADWDPRIAEALEKAGPLPDLWPLFRALRPFPTLALRGELSTLLSESCFERMGREHPNLTRTVVPNRGHPPTLEEPESRSAIDAFFAALP